MGKRQHHIFTIGYEGASIPAFIAALRKAGVTLVLDVRAIAASRKKGFSKTPLAAHLAEAGIGYKHLRGLGTPKTGRDAAHSGDHATFERVFLAHMKEPEALLDLGEALAVSQAEKACLLCLERDPEQCHRLIVAERMAKESGQRIEHLYVET
ncbi:MAG: DUF488 domain-containing protein [Alphaproteobacteria bacterium]|nr:DUF488 domain-containing protein [Alphaproteobacteria bacterium]